MNYTDIHDELKKIIDGDVSIDIADRTKLSTDWSLFQIIPDMIVYPKHAEDIQKLVQFVNKYNQNHDEKLSLTARAAGSGMTGGSLNHSIIVDVTRHMNHIRTVERGNFGNQEHKTGAPYTITGKATAEPGIYYRDFEPETLKHNLIMPVFPASRDLCALGGMVANNGAGEKSLKYGQNTDFVDSLEVILKDGNQYTLKPWNYNELQTVIGKGDLLANIAREIYGLMRNNWELIQSKKPTTSKNASGYLVWQVISALSIADFENGTGFFDLTKLIVGAQGTTGIISEITYKLVEYEDQSEMLVMFVDDIHKLPGIVSTLQHYDLETIELYDDHTFKIGIKFFRDFMRDKGFFASIRYALRFMPEFWMAITGGVPKFVVLAENVDRSIETVDRESENELEKIRSAFPTMKSFIVRGKKQSQKYWDFRHDSFKLLTEHSMKSRKTGTGTRTAPFIDDIVINPEHLPDYLPRLTEILDEYKDEFLYTIAGHLGNGNFHIIPLVDMNKDENKQRILEISERVYKLVREYNGSMSAEHNDGIIRTPFLPDMFGDEMMNIFTQIKTIFDPNNIFNPGKKVGMTKDDIQKYLV